MIKRAVENFEKNRAGLRAVFAAKHPDNYKGKPAPIPAKV